MNQLIFEESEACPLSKMCEATTEGAAPCGTLPEHLPPLDLAKDLCQRAVAGRMEYEQRIEMQEEADLPLSVQASMRDLRLAWLSVEGAMPEQVERTHAEDCFDDAAIYAARVVNNNQTYFPVVQDALLLQAHLPLFKALRSDTELTPEQHQHITQDANVRTASIARAALSAPLHARKALPGHHVSQEGHSPCFKGEIDQYVGARKLATMLLARRAGLTVYPASFRESRTFWDCDVPKAGCAYDYYTFSDDNQKIPIKIGAATRSALYDPSVLSIGYDGLVKDRLSKKPRYNKTDMRTHPKYAVSWLIQEVLGESLGGRQLGLLDEITVSFAKRIKTFSA